MNTDDYKELEECKKLCDNLCLELLVDDSFVLANSEVYLKRFSNVKTMYFYLQGYHQCKRIENKEYNEKVLNQEINY